MFSLVCLSFFTLCLLFTSFGLLFFSFVVVRQFFSVDIDGPRVSCITLDPTVVDASGRGDGIGDKANFSFIFKRVLVIKE